VRKKRTIFISYSHRDGRWLKELTTALAPALTSYQIDPWDDRRIQPGAAWRKEIDDALARANLAVLLVTPLFFASKFIQENELPVVLRRRDKDRLPVVWIPVSATSYQLTPLQAIEAAHDPKRPLDMLTKPKRD
jgi:internalin A